MISRLPRVFISYQRTDSDVARRVREHLEGHGVATWMDQFDIPVGAYWPDEIDKSLMSSDIVVGILSPEAVESRNVKNEWDWALQHDKPLLLVMTRPSDVPHRYVSINFIDGTADLDHALDVLLQALGVDTSESATAALPPSVRHRLRPVTRRYLSPPMLVGREPEQAQLEARLADALAGHGSLVLLSGEAGIGKTTLTSWLLWAAEERGALVRLGGCYDLTTTPPYGPWGEILRGWPGADSGVPDVPVELREGTGMGTIQSQAAFFALAGNFLVEAAQTRPLVLALEDLHWSDQASLDFLHHAARLVGDSQLLLVCTWRDDELTRRHPLYALLPSLARSERACRVQLPRLEASALAELIASRYALAAPDVDRLRDYVQRLTEGNPFFAGEVLRTIEETGALRGVEGGWQLGPLEQIHVPSLVQQVIEHRLARLGDGVRPLLEVAAVIGHDVPIDLWVAVSDAEEVQLATALEQATEARLVVESSDRARFKFTHALVRETLYEGLVSLRLRTWHRKVADTLIDQPRPVPDTIAHHLLQAGDARAFDWLVRAGELARLRYAWLDAIARYERAVALIADDPSRAQERGWLLYRIGVLLRGSNPRRGIAYAEAACEFGRSTGDRTLEAYAVFMRGLLHAFAGDAPTGVPLMDTGAHLVEQLTTDDLERSGQLLTSVYAEVERLDPGWWPDYLAINAVRGTVIQWLAIMGHFREAVEQGEAFVALGVGRTLPPPTAHQIADAFHALAFAITTLGEVVAGRAYFEQAVDGYRSIGHFWLLRITVQVFFFQSHWPYNADDPLERAYLQGIVAEAEQRVGGATGEDDVQPFGQFIDDLFADRWDDVVQYWANEQRRLGGPQRRLARIHIGEILRQRGDREQAWAAIVGYVPPSATDDVQIGNYRQAIFMRVAIALHLDDGDLDGAERWLQSYELWLRRSGAVTGRADGALLRARYHFVAGDLTLAREYAERAVVHATDPRQPLALIAAHRYLGELLTELGELGVAAEQLQAASEVAQLVGIRSEIAWTQLALAELEAARGKTGVARLLLDDVRAVFDPLDAKPTLERVAALEERLVSSGGC